MRQCPVLSPLLAPNLDTSLPVLGYFNSTLCVLHFVLLGRPRKPFVCIGSLCLCGYLKRCSRVKTNLQDPQQVRSRHNPVARNPSLNPAAFALFADCSRPLVSPDGAAWDLARSLLQPRNGLVCARPTADMALQHRFLTQELTWQVEEERVGSARRGSAWKLSVPAFSLFGGSRSAEESSDSAASARRRRNLIPSFLWRQRDDTSEIGSESGVRFDRKVKLKADLRGTTVQWSAFLPLNLPTRKNSQTQEASFPSTVNPSTDPLLGLKRLVGLEAPTATALPSPPPQNEEFPHVAALAALLGQRDQAGPQTRGQEDDPLSASVLQVEEEPTNQIQKNAVRLALAGAVLGGFGWLVSLPYELFLK